MIWHGNYIKYSDTINYTYPNEILPEKLYLGSAKHASYLQVLIDLKITHIVNMTRSIDCFFENLGNALEPSCN